MKPVDPSMQLNHIGWLRKSSWIVDSIIMANSSSLNAFKRQLVHSVELYLTEITSLVDVSKQK